MLGPRCMRNHLGFSHYNTAIHNAQALEKHIQALHIESVITFPKHSWLPYLLFCRTVKVQWQLSSVKSGLVNSWKLLCSGLICAIEITRPPSRSKLHTALKEARAACLYPWSDHVYPFLCGTWWEFIPRDCTGWSTTQHWWSAGLLVT